MTNTSVTLQETGIADAINDGGPYDSARNKMMALDFATQLQEMKAIAGQPDFALGSVHAVTREERSSSPRLPAASSPPTPGAPPTSSSSSARRSSSPPWKRPASGSRAQPEARGRPRVCRLRAEQPGRKDPRDPPGGPRADPRRPHPTVGRVLRRQVIDEEVLHGQPDLASAYLAPEMKWHGGLLGTVEGVANVTEMLRGFIGALPDLHAREQDAVRGGRHRRRSLRRRGRRTRGTFSGSSRPVAGCAGTLSTSTTLRTG